MTVRHTVLLPQGYDYSIASLTKKSYRQL